ncbi:MAG: hypothetical protein WCA39_18250 [Nitrososphaeraceae archaeon]
MIHEYNFGQGPATPSIPFLIGKDIKKLDINKNLKGLWELTYWILNEEPLVK